MHTRTLLLSPWYLPVKVLRWQDAVKMRYEATADVLVEYDDEIASPSVVWKVPAVMRLRRMPTPRKHGLRFSRLNVYQRDGFRCQYCGEKRPASELNYDHVQPRFRGGKTVWENIVTSCYACNDRKGSRTPAEAGMTLLRQPSKPKSLPLPPVIRPGSIVPEVWRDYCALGG